MINKQSYQIQGMRQDNLVSTGFSSKFAHEIMNMRFNTIGDYTTASWTTEKGTLKVNVGNLKGYTGGDVDLTNFNPLGQANINDVWVLFGKLDVSEDAIVKFKYEGNTLYKALLYKGDLGFNFENPIETLTFFENDNIQKVYWTDGINQPRVINIAVNKSYNTDYKTQFDFVQEVSLNEEVKITKENSGTGLFPPCTVKYCLTYYHKYGPESNIVYESPLYYPTLGDRACSPDELSGDSFKIVVDNLDKNHGFDYIRLYSIIRTSDNATPIVRIVEDKYIENVDSVTFLDTNTKGMIIDPTVLNYIGGRNISAKTIDQKNNTLFLGNIKLNQSSLQSFLKFSDVDKVVFSYSSTKEIPVQLRTDTVRKSSWDYINQLNTLYNQDGTVLHYGNSNEIKIFKYGEWYRFGIQAQDVNGVWSDVVYISDSKNNIIPQYYSFDINPYEYYRVGEAVFTLDSIKSKALKDNNYKKVRLVCCYPTNADRSRIAQGIINKTVYTEKEQEDNSPYCMSSWWFRPYVSNIEDDEIQSQKENSEKLKYKTSLEVWTLNSPDIELDESIRTLDPRAFDIKSIGVLPVTLVHSSMYIDAIPATSVGGTKGSGLSQKTISKAITSTYTTLHPTSYTWGDYDVYYPHGKGSGAENYKIYPFQRDILNNYIKEVEWYNDHIGGAGTDFVPVTIKETAKINSKVYANLLYVKTTDYTPTSIVNGITKTTSVNFFDSLEVMPVVLDSGKIYYGNVNTIAQVSTDNLKTKGVLLIGREASGIPDNAQIKALFTGSYTIGINNTARTSNAYNGFYYNNNDDIIRESDNSTSFVSSDPIKIAYKSTPHLVFEANIIPFVQNQSITNEDTKPDKTVLYLADVTRDVSSDQRFGGTHTDINNNNIYIPCGPAVNIDSINGTIVRGLEGDHYLMRYDCLKTYPYTTEDPNQIVEIASYFTETRINLDGRYDKNRGNVDNTLVLPTNFNLINKSYTQTNNFFSYIEIDDLSASLNSFNNQFTWTKEKVSGEDVDAWTNITLASTADADGTLGEINRIINLNDNLMLFQDHGLAKIEFNESTAISTENGLPLELAKTGKYTGLNYITREIGCQNKWSISLTKNGLSWIDDSRQEILKYTNEGIQPLSTINGFDAFMIKQLPNTFESWNPIDFNNFVTYYDKLSNDVYYINKNTCIAWNEQTNTFTSFYSYNNVPYMMNVGSHSLIWNNGIWAARETDSYSTFFGTTKDYWMTLVCDGMTDKGSAFPADKVFNNIEYRADVYNLDGTNTNYSKTVFNKQQVWNGYQDTNECNLEGIRKFNTWRVQLPRNAGTRDRIRNPFCYIKLKQNQLVSLQTDRMILHDLAVYFDMK